MGSAANTEKELRALMVAAQDGDDIAYCALLSALSGRLRGYYRGRLLRAGRGMEETEDLVQDTLLAVHAKRHTYDPAEPLTPWIYAIARYKLIDYLRRSQSLLADVPIEHADEVIAYDEQAASESSLDLDKLLDRLPERQRLAIRYIKLDGLSVAEAAKRCGMSPSAIKVNVHRGLKALGAIVAQEIRK
jgi:RNA polymerase sigma-70 factor (ECF subfamily)